MNRALRRELEAVRARLREAEETLHAIRNGEVDALVVTGDDGTERVFTLRGAETPYRVLVEQMPEGAAILGADGMLVWANQRFADMVRRPLQGLLATPLPELVDPASRDDVRPLLAHGGKVEVLLDQNGTGWTPALLALSRLPDEDGIAVIATDLTPHKRTAALLASEKLATSILRNAAEAIVVCNAERQVIRANPAARKLCLCTPVGMPFGDAFRLRAAGGRGPVDAALAGEVVRSVEALLETPAGDLVVLVSAGPLLGHAPEPTGCVVTVTDITERKRFEHELAAHRERLEELVRQRTDELRRSLEELQHSERLASLGTLATGIAHEINNPLNSILLAATWAAANSNAPAASDGGAPDDGAGAAEVQQALQLIREEAERGSRIVKNILRFAKNERSALVATDLNQLVRHIGDLARKSLRLPDLRLRFELEPLPPVPLNATEIEQVLVNLIKNALDAGGPETAILLRTTPAADHVELTVRDDGPGIPESEIGRVFDPFWSTRRKTGGTGLGLSICHRIVADHGGTIGVASTVGVGTEFRIRLPIPVAAPRENTSYQNL